MLNFKIIQKMETITKKINNTTIVKRLEKKYRLIFKNSSLKRKLIFLRIQKNILKLNN